MEKTTAKTIAYELRQNIIDLLDLLHTNTLKTAYENQEQFIIFLRLLFNAEFTKRIIEWREILNIPKDWYRSLRHDAGADGTWENWVNTHSEAPKEPTDRLVLRLCAEFELDPLGFGLFIVDYLYFSSVDFPFEAGDPDSKEGFKYKARILVQPESTVNRDNQKLSAYVQIFKDTSPTGLGKFFSINEKEIRKIQEQLNSYPIARVRSVKIFKRDLEVFLLNALDFTAGEIGTIISGKERITEFVDEFKKENETYFAELPSLSSPEQVMEIITHRNSDEIYSLSDTDIRTIISNFNKDLQKSPFEE